MSHDSDIKLVQVLFPLIAIEAERVGTPGVDRIDLRLNAGTGQPDRAVNLSDFITRRIAPEKVEILFTRTGLSGKLVLKNFDACIDQISTAQGDFTLAEILAYGNNAPIQKQARATAELLNPNPKKPLPPIPGCGK